LPTHIAFEHSEPFLQAITLLPRKSGLKKFPEVFFAPELRLVGKPHDNVISEARQNDVDVPIAEGLLHACDDFQGCISWHCCL